MEIKYDYRPFNKAIAAMWPSFKGRSVCAVEGGKVLGGCGFTRVVGGVVEGYLLGLENGWASRELYAAMLRMPFTMMGAEEIHAYVGKNNKSANVCRHLGGERRAHPSGSKFVFTKEKSLAWADGL